MKRRKRLMCAEIGEVEYEETFENEVLMRMDLERILVEISEELRIPQGTIRNAHYRIRRCIRSYFDA